MWQVVYHGLYGEAILATFGDYAEALSVRNGYIATGTVVFLRKIT